MRVIFSEPLIIRFAPSSSSRSGAFSGIASTPNPDRHGDIVETGAFADSIAELTAGKRTIPLLMQHDARDQIGVIQSASEDDEGLHVEGNVVDGTASAQRALQLMRAGGMSLSVGFAPIPSSTQKRSGRGTIYRNVDWVETSAVSTPSNHQSRVIEVKSLGDLAPADFERLLREGELPPLPRRLAAKVTREWLAVLNGDEPSKPEHDAGQLARTLAAAQAAINAFKSR
jgi:uncharacterized protein